MVNTFNALSSHLNKQQVWLLLINAADLRLQENTVSVVGATCVEEHDDIMVSCSCFQEKRIH